LRLALPVLAEHLLHLLVIFSDTVLTGRYLGTEELAAMNVIFYAVWFLENLFGLVAIGSTAMVARFVGAGDWRTARRTVNQSFLAGAVLALVLTALGVLFVDDFVLAMQLSGRSAQLASEYLLLVILVLPVIMVETIAVACLRGAGDTVSGLIVMSIVVVVNLLVSWSLIAGWGPLPELGFLGLAIGTAAAHVTGGVLLLALLLRGRAGLKLQLRGLRPDWALIRRLLRIGVPGGTDVILIVVCHLAYMAIINALGDMAAAAHGVAVKIEALAYLPGAAFQVAAATLAGQYLGAGDHAKATRSVLLCLAIGGAGMTAMGVVFSVAATPLSEMFLGESKPDVIAKTAPLLRIVAVTMPALAIAMILGGALRGAGDTRVPMVLNLIGYLGVRLPLAYFLAHKCGMGVEGAWLAMVADVFVRCGLILWRFLHGGWKRIKV
jgi:putative MATE family efflux protein